MKELIKIQSELHAPKNQRNNFGKYNYRSCEDILEAVKPLLKKHECTLAISDTIKEVAGIMFVESMATLSNKDESVYVTAQSGIDINRKGMDVAQSFGSSSSYARKYALNGLFLIDDSKQEPIQDPDGLETRAPIETKKEKSKVRDFEGLLKAVIEGKVTIEKAIATYDFTPEQKNKLLAV